MLNEKIEFENYTWPLSCKAPVYRLKYTTISNGLSGMARAMTIIARKCYFDKEVPDKIDYCKDTLRIWCGDPKGNKENASEDVPQNWLPDYLHKVLGETNFLQFEDYLDQKEETLGNDYENICKVYKDLRFAFDMNLYWDKTERKDIVAKCDFIEDIAQRRQKIDKKDTLLAKFGYIRNTFSTLITLQQRYSNRDFNKRIFNDKLGKTGNNDYRQITYDKIIADAVTEGPLVRYYLVCEKESFKRVWYNKKTLKKATKIDEKKDLLRKTVATYLLGRKNCNYNTDEFGFVPINLTDLLNWMKSNSAIKLKTYTYNNDKDLLFEEITINKNQKMIRINESWIEECGWSVIREEELDMYLTNHPGAVYYRDDGASFLLRQNKRYE